jgi:Flp pilus assembly protein TadG
MATRRPFGVRRGNAMLETSLCLVLFMSIFVGIMEFGWAVYNYNFVSYAAREGVRYAATRGSQCQSPCTQATSNSVQTLIRNEAVVMDSSQITVTTTYPQGNMTPGNQVTVNVSYPIPPLLGWLAGNMTINASSTMRIAQ